ncbi:MAG TPA: recombinase family protein [Pilimelia sp.]|nr:recombinase family protein [Pilimelia sp.]
MDFDNPRHLAVIDLLRVRSQRLAGRSVASIARELNERGVPCASSADPGRNRHRSGEAWMVTTVAAILANPR